MKCHILIVALLLVLLSACSGQTPRDAWTMYHADSGTLVNPNFPSYSFEYPSYWEIDEGANRLVLVSEAKLFKDVPDKLEPGQIIVGLSLNKDMSPAEMVETEIEHLQSTIDGMYYRLGRVKRERVS